MNKKVQLTYTGFIEKAEREIDRLKSAENDLDIVAALDHAFNAAFTIYHLLEWQQNPLSLSEQELKKSLKDKGKVYKSAHKLCQEINSSEMNILHGVVTHTKHATVSRPIPDIDSAPYYSPNYEEEIKCLATEKGERIVTESGIPIVTEDSTITVHFGDSVALVVLENALNQFK